MMKHYIKLLNMDFLPKPSINRIIQHRLAEKDFINNLNIRTTRYVSIEKRSDMDSVEDLLPGLLKTTNTRV